MVFFSMLYDFFFGKKQDDLDPLIPPEYLTLDQRRALLSQNLHREMNRDLHRYGPIKKAQLIMSARADKEAARVFNPVLRKDQKEVADYLKRTDSAFQPTTSQALHKQLARDFHRCDAMREAMGRWGEVADEEAAEARKASISRESGEPVSEGKPLTYFNYCGDHLTLCTVSETLKLRREFHVNRVDGKLPGFQRKHKNPKKFHKTPECIVCGMEYTQELEMLPVVLDCRHTICSSCSEEILKSNGHFHYLRCPHCRHDTILGDKLPERFMFIDKDIDTDSSESSTSTSSGCISDCDD